jgi:outer membrane protein assembly factor BamB
MNFRNILFISALFLIGFSAGHCQSEISKQWPQFRGYQGAGILNGTNVPLSWDMKTGENILWKTAIPGLAHSCPVVWDDKVFVTTAVSSAKMDSLKIGLYGDIDMADDRSVHQFKA